MAIDSDQFRASMRHLAGHVCIITTADSDGLRNGLTATAVCSVSAEPPTILCCVNKNNGSYDAIVKNGSFVINVLAETDQDLSNRFAGKIFGDERFAEGEWTTLSTDSPVLATALASFDCTVAKNVDGGDSHAIFMGEIQAVKAKEGNEQPLIYAHGSYGTFAADAK